MESSVCKEKRSKFGATWGDVLGYFAARGYGEEMGPGQLWLRKGLGQGRAALASNTLFSM